MIIQNKEKLNIKCEPCKSIEEGEKIGAQLLKELTESGNGIGLAANQIGINKRVCVLNIKDPIVLVNPKIVEKSEDKFAFMEGCLSFPGQAVKTQRHKWVKVQADNHNQTLFFSVWDDNGDGYDKDKYLQMAYETACIQHEIDHLDGITMYDRELIMEPVKRAVPKIGRNEKVTITDGTETKVIKYKKAIPLIKSGGWELSDIQINANT
jgi:peptide deformylase